MKPVLACHAKTPDILLLYNGMVPRTPGNLSFHASSKNVSPYSHFIICPAQNAESTRPICDTCMQPTGSGKVWGVLLTACLPCAQFDICCLLFGTHILPPRSHVGVEGHCGYHGDLPASWHSDETKFGSFHWLCWQAVGSNLVGWKHICMKTLKCLILWMGVCVCVCCALVVSMSKLNWWQHAFKASAPHWFVSRAHSAAAWDSTHLRPSQFCRRQEGESSHGQSKKWSKRSRCSRVHKASMRAH